MSTDDKKDTKKSDKEEKVPVLLTCPQICNNLRINSYDRKVVEIKFSNKKLTEDGWKKKLKEIGFNF